MPQGTTLDIYVHASEYEYACSDGAGDEEPVACTLATRASAAPSTGGTSEPFGRDNVLSPMKVEPAPDWFRGPFCANLEWPVSEVTFAVDGRRVYTTTRSMSVSYPWDIGGMSAGEEQSIRVTARAADGGFAGRRCVVSIAREGVSARRRVVRSDNVFQISLTVEYHGTTDVELDSIRDNVTRFQPIRQEQDDYAVTTFCDPVTQRCCVEMEISDGTGDSVTLHPGETSTAEYLAVPALQSCFYAQPAIGVETTRVRYAGHLGSVEEGFSIPGMWVTDSDTHLAGWLGRYRSGADR